MAVKKKDTKKVTPVKNTKVTKAEKITKVELVEEVTVTFFESKVKPIIGKVSDWFMNFYKEIGLFGVGLIIGLAIMALIGYGNITKTTDGDDIYVSVTGLEITANELYKDLKTKYGVTKVVAQIDDYILTTKYAKQKGDAEDNADKYIESLKGQYTEKWTDFLSYYGFADDKALRESLITNYYADLVRKEYVTKTISESAINDYYKNSVVGDIKASHILIKFDYATDASEEEIKTSKDKALATAESVVTQLKASDKPLDLFVTLAKKYSGDEANASKGGDLGYFNKGQMEESFETAAYKLSKVGEYTLTPVETSYGYHIIIKTAKTKAKDSLKDAKEGIVANLVAKKIESDPSLSLKAMMDLREQYKLTFQEPKTKTEYNEAMVTKINEILKEADSANSAAQ